MQRAMALCFLFFYYLVQKSRSIAYEGTVR